MIWGHAADRWPDYQRRPQAGGTYLAYLFLLDITTTTRDQTKIAEHSGTAAISQPPTPTANQPLERETIVPNEQTTDALCGIGAH